MRSLTLIASYLPVPGTKLSPSTPSTNDDTGLMMFDVGGLGVQPPPQSFSTFCENQQEGEICEIL